MLLRSQPRSTRPEVDRQHPLGVEVSPPSTLIRRALLVLVVIGALATAVWTVRNVDTAEDLRIYRWAMDQVVSGKSPYLPLRIGTLPYHPASLTLFWPLRSLPLSLAWAVWTVLSAVAWVWTVTLAQRLVRTVAPAPWTRVELALCAATFGPALETLYSGQVDLFVCAGLCASIWYAEQERPAMAGVSLALASVLKPSPILLLAYFAAVRRHRAVLWGVFAMAALTVVAAVHHGWGLVGEYLIAAEGMATTIRANRFNLSLLTSAFVAARRVGLEQPARAILAWADPLTLAVLGVLLVRIWRLRQTTARRVQIGAAVLVVMSVCSPLVWYHHAAFLVLPLMLIPATSGGALGVSLLLLIQLERTFESAVWRFPLPFVVMELALLVWALGCLWVLGSERVVREACVTASGTSSLEETPPRRR
jgi:hypothetical protein